MHIRFTKVTGLITNEPAVANLDKVIRMNRSGDGNGTVLTMEDGNKIYVNRTLDDIWEAISQVEPVIDLTNEE